MRTAHRSVLTQFAATVLLCSVACQDRTATLETRAPDFVLEDTNGKRFYLSAQKGTAVLLNFWSVYCVPCIREMPHLQKLHEELGTRGITVVGVCTDPGEEGRLESYLEDLGVTYRVLLDRDSTVARLYSVTVLPTTYVIDTSGSVRNRTLGYAPGYEKTYRALLQPYAGGAE
jgi:peroxiredoxin